MILRSVSDLAVPFTNNQTERDIRPVKIQQCASGGCWRTLTGLADFAVVTSYLSTAANGASTASTCLPNCSVTSGLATATLEPLNPAEQLRCEVLPAPHIG